MLFLDDLFVSACFFCAMELKDLLVISLTANACTIVFFVARAVIGHALACARERMAEKSLVRSLIDKHDDEPWRLPRFCVDILQSFLLTGLGVAILCMEDVIHEPFRGPFGNLTATGYTIAIGCYLYRICQDAVLRKHLKHFKVDLVHHLVALAVCSVFVTYKENALFAAIGLISTGSVPSVEVSQLLKTLCEASGRPTAMMASYRHNLVAGAVITFITRLVLPAMLGGFALTRATPLTMSVPVVAFFFTSLMFFGAINIWLCAMSVRSLYRLRRRHLKDMCVNALEGGRGQTFPTNDTQQATILAKKNPISRLAPCANINLAPQTPAHMSKNNSLPNNYAKLPVNDALSLPLSLMRGTTQLSSDNISEHSDTSSSGEMTVLPVGDDAENSRPRAVRFLVPATASSASQESTSDARTRRGHSLRSRENLSLPSDTLQLSELHSDGSEERTAVSSATNSLQTLPTRTSHVVSSSMTTVMSIPSSSSNITNTAQQTQLISALKSPSSTTCHSHSDVSISPVFSQGDVGLHHAQGYLDGHLVPCRRSVQPVASSPTAIPSQAVPIRPIPSTLASSSSSSSSLNCLELSSSELRDLVEM